MSRFAVLRPDFSGDQILVLIRDTETGTEHFRTVTDTMRSTIVDELETADVAYIQKLRLAQDGDVHEHKQPNH